MYNGRIAMEVKDIVKDAVTISEDASFREAVSAMMNGKTNTLLVVDEEGKLVGEVSVADLLDGVVPEYLDGDSIAAHFATEEMFESAIADAEEKQVQFFMSHDFSTVEMDDGLMAVAATAIAHQRARIPVIDKDGRPIGIISRQGLKHIIAKFLGIKDSA
ncbi:MAG: CBS domain-containing protein [Candidatus Paceibacterota bacterium]